MQVQKTFCLGRVILFMATFVLWHFSSHFIFFLLQLQQGWRFEDLVKLNENIYFFIGIPGLASSLKETCTNECAILVLLSLPCLQICSEINGWCWQLTIGQEDWILNIQLGLTPHSSCLFEISLLTLSGWFTLFMM